MKKFQLSSNLKFFTIFLTLLIGFSDQLEDNGSSVIVEQWQDDSLYPVILVPGYMGSRLYVQMDSTAQLPVFCGRLPRTWTLWLSMRSFIPLINQCWLYGARLQYDPRTHKTHNSRGVRVIVPSFGGLDAVDNLLPWIPDQLSPGSYFSGLIDSLEKVGYKREYNLAGAPYDWRKSMNEQSNWFNLFKALCERMYRQNDNRKVILMGHSMGGSMIYVFLQKQEQQWKDKYIRALIPLATPFIGNFKYMYDYLFVDDYPASMSPIIRQAERTYPSMAFLVPNKKFWNNTVFITTPTFNYTPFTYEKFFKDINQPIAFQMYQDVENLMEDLQHPRVDVYCYGGYGQRTLRSMIAKSNNLYNVIQREVIYGDGDEFVNIESLQSCIRWEEQSGEYKFKYKVFKTTHMGIIRDSSVTSIIAKEIREIP
ncbi:lysosomal phospholipase A and acyltransferase-like [Brevipalpus obovatus]|uniref:lysosomal phospholipase A and acyltransferase-like n=1 Tax=Brevipalpus obovatus TaxID=246614 RepID=UPI003D9ED2DC